MLMGKFFTERADKKWNVHNKGFFTVRVVQLWKPYEKWSFILTSTGLGGAVTLCNIYESHSLQNRWSLCNTYQKGFFTVRGVTLCTSL